MLQDTENLQPQDTAVSEGTEVLQAPAAPPAEPVQPKLLTEEEFNKRLAEREDAISRRWQSQADRQIAQAKREIEAQLAQAQVNNEARVGYLESQEFARLDPEEQLRIRLQRLEAQSQMLLQRPPIAPQPIPKVDPLTLFIQAQGVDPNDSRLDYAMEVLDPKEGMRRLSESIAKIKAVKPASSQPTQATPPSVPPVETPGMKGRKPKDFGELEQAYIDGEINASQYNKARREMGL